MESDAERQELAQQLHEIERGQAAPWLAAPSLGWWWPAMFGVWTATYTLTNGLLDGAVKALVLLVHVLVMLAAVGWMRRVRGTYPRGRSPRELHPAFALLFAGALALAVVVWWVHTSLGAVPAAGVGLVLAWVLVAVYERMYAAAVERARERIG